MSNGLSHSTKALLRHQKPLMIHDAPVKRSIFVDEFKQLNFVPSKTFSNSVRYIIEDGEISQSVKRAQEPYVRSKSVVLRAKISIADNRNLLNFKAVAFSRSTKNRIGSTFSAKVGSVVTGSTIGQRAQAVGSVIAPLDTSGFRSPIRSRAYASITPGGNSNPAALTAPLKGGVRRAAQRAVHGYRCPAGFQFGGRFTNRQYGTCGEQLFGIPTPLGTTIGKKADPAGVLASVVPQITAVPEAPTSLAEVADTAMTPERTAQIMQMAQIPRDTVDNPKAVAKSVQSALGVLAGAKNGESYLIRRDGITLQALVPTTVLRNFAGNPDMMDGTFIKALSDPTDILGSDLGLLAGPAVRQIIYVMQNNSTLSIERKRPLTVGERRKFGRQLNKVGATGDKYDVGNNIRAFANASGGAFGYTEKFPNLQNPLDMIEVSDGGKKVQVHRWVYDTFLAHGGHSEVSKVRSDTTTIQDAPMTLEQAIQTLNGGGDPFSIPEEFLAQALEESDAYARPTTANQLAMLKKPNSMGVREFNNRAGETIRLIPEDMQYDAISQRVYIDIASQLGLQTPKIRFAGSPKKRAMLVGEILGVDQHTDPKKPLAKVDEKDMLALAFADFLGDVRGRSPATLERIVTPSKTSLVPTTNQPSLLAGLKPEEIKPRLDMSVQDYFDGRATRIFRERFDNLQKSQRENLVKVYDTLLQQAQNFKWDEYLSSISADGHLTDDEQAHLKTVSKMYLKRVEELKNNKQQVLQLLGI